MQPWGKAPGTPPPLGLRGRIARAAAQGQPDTALAQRFQSHRKSVILGRERFARQGPESLWEIAPGRGRKPLYPADPVKASGDATWHTPPKGRMHGSWRRRAKSQGVSKSPGSHIWRSPNLKPQRVKTFPLSRHPQFWEKLTEGVGLDLNPPQPAIVLCVEEKSPRPARDRTPPGRPLKKGGGGTRTPDHEHHGTRTGFAAWELGQGRVLAQCSARHRPQAWLKFLRRLHEEVSRRSPAASGDGPRRHPQDSPGSAWAPPPPSVHPALRAHPFPLAPSPRARVGGTDQQAGAPRCLRQRGGFAKGP